jgi:tRNA pseudouridine55 synthase
MHSALKKDGQPLYALARAGVEVERAPRTVTIHALTLTPIDAQTLALSVTCSKGTYIRTLGEDIGAALGCGAHLTALRRTATGSFDLTQCLTLDALENKDEAERLACLLPPEALLTGHAPIVLTDLEAGRFLTGLRRRGSWPDTSQVAVFGDRPRALLGTAHVAGGELIPDRLLSPVELQQMLGAQQRPTLNP